MFAMGSEVLHTDVCVRGCGQGRATKHTAGGEHLFPSLPFALKGRKKNSPKLYPVSLYGIVTRPRLASSPHTPLP